MKLNMQLDLFFIYCRQVNNFYNIYIILSKELDKIAVNKTDQKFRTETLKEFNYHVEINNKQYVLRNKESFEIIKLFYSKIFSKLDDFMVVDGCLNELYIKINNTSSNLNESNIFFPEPGFVSKTIYGNYITTIEEIGNLDRINIFPRNKAIEYKNGKSLNTEHNLMKYSETNPLEYSELKNNLIRTFEEFIGEKKEGNIKLIYNVIYSSDGNNMSYFHKINTSHNIFNQYIKTSISQTKLNPSKLCGNFINSTDSINLNLKWQTYNKRFHYTEGGNSDYSHYFASKSLPYGTYKFTVREKILNDKKYKDIFISDYSIRGPFSSLYSILIPGWGTRKVTYNEKKGWDRFALVAVPLVLSIAFKNKSRSYYNEYMRVTGQNDIDQYFKTANTWNKNSIIFAGIGLTFYAFDISWVFYKGLKNVSKKQQIKNRIKNSEFQIQTQPLI